MPNMGIAHHSCHLVHGSMVLLLSISTKQGRLVRQEQLIAVGRNDWRR